ncbi:unnamed protein product [Symbiodinium natans]|uniref:Uncharacterized protein n=1 Tax=Symbiodinium natans TaxID=878477 RepID=A0A812T292_9DINO|nr:unnamed protein product [Symbiodinium natans]
MDAEIQNAAEDMDACATTPHSPSGDRIGRLLEQMRTCVLVHHQLSCLLIHASALDAGVYGEAGFDESTEEGNDALRRSIQSLGGSTARLFCMALRDQKDLRSMSHTLQSRVESMVEGLQSELGLMGDADCTALTAEVTDLEAALARKREEVQELRRLTDDRRTLAEEKHRTIVMQQAERVKAAERRLQVLQHAWDDLDYAGLDASVARSPAAQAAQALLGPLPRSPSPDAPGPHTLQRQQHENQLERRYSPATRRVRGGPPQAVVQTTPQRIVGGSRLPSPGKPQQAFSSLAQLDAQLRAAQTEFWSL